MTPVWTRHGALAAALVAVLAIAVGGYLLGRKQAPTPTEAAVVQKAARAGAQREAERAAARKAAEQGRHKGLAEGRRNGQTEGSQRGAEQAAREREERKRELAQVVVDCPATGAEPNISKLSARNMSCQEAVSVIASFGTIDKDFSAKGFQCSRISGAELGGTWRCVEGDKAFRFEFGD